MEPEKTKDYCVIIIGFVPAKKLSRIPKRCMYQADCIALLECCGL